MDAANRYRMAGIAKWCNGSTTDSGSVCLGSNPSLATKKKDSQTESLSFLC